MTCCTATASAASCPGRTTRSPTRSCRPIFKEVVADQIEAIREAHPDEQVQVWFEDEARFGQQGTLTRVWARRGSRPRGVRQTGYTFLYVLTAVCASTGAASGLISPTLNAEVVNLFLEQFSRERLSGVHAVLLWDGAGYHISDGLRIREECEFDPAIAVLARAEPGGEPVALPAKPLLVAPGVPGLRGVGGGGGRSLARGVPEAGVGRSICTAPYVSNCA